MSYVEIDFLDIEEKVEYIDFINKIVEKCFEVENLLDKKLYMSIILTNPENIQKTNKQYRDVDNATDVLSFPMFEKEELENYVANNEEVLGDIMISVDKVKEQAIEFGHSFDRELAYMIVHGFYHLMGYEHMVEEDKIQMRAKEEGVLNLLGITRE